MFCNFCPFSLPFHFHFHFCFYYYCPFPWPSPPFPQSNERTRGSVQPEGGKQIGRPAGREGRPHRSGAGGGGTGVGQDLPVGQGTGTMACPGGGGGSVPRQSTATGPGTGWVGGERLHPAISTQVETPYKHTHMHIYMHTQHIPNNPSRITPPVPVQGGGALFGSVCTK